MGCRFNYLWTLKDADFTKDKGKVFSCFACGGGSTMGYKLAGYDVIGCNEIDAKINRIYVANHHPRYNYCESIQTFKLRKDIPQELYQLDILDGSPPCSTFSMAGNRDKDWGKMKKFREGQAEQVLDVLFFDFIDLAKRLQPKVVVAENVKGLLLGSAIDYVRRIYSAFDDAGYYCQHWLFDSSQMGVPQKRERVFFVCLRKDLAEPFLYQKDFFTIAPKIDMTFNENVITCRECNLELGKPLKGFALEDWTRLKKGEPQKYLQSGLVDIDSVHPTLTEGYSEKANPMPEWKPCWLSDSDLCKVGSFPLDYNFNGIKAHKLIGLSVPPVMMAQLSSRIYEQWLSKIKLNTEKETTKNRREPIQLTLF